ncbi:MAG: DUF4032 domain-containing protein [Acidimicrobiia bacterium]|jgi:hypothetical protein
MKIPKLQVRPGNPDFLDLPWDRALTSWDTDRQVSMPTGIHRHPVLFVAYDEGIYAIKELSLRSAHNEYRVLRVLQEQSHSSAEPIGLVERDWMDRRNEGAGAVITRFVEHSFPYRNLISGAGFGSRRTQMLDALAGLLVELHMAGCYWGDCSLSNVLYRFDAGAIEAIMIDGETSEIHPSLSDGQRLQDIEVMKENVAGEMSDIAAEMGEDLSSADLELGADIESRYDGLWKELTEELVITRNDAYRIRERIGRINELGFAVDDIELTPADGGNLVKLRVHVGGRTYNSDILRQRTGVEASENQARSILGDLNYYLAKHGDLSTTAKNVGTFKWLNSVYEPLIERIREIWHGEDPVQGYCDYLSHRIAIATKRGADVDVIEAFDDWIAAGLPGIDPERV